MMFFKTISSGMFLLDVLEIVVDVVDVAFEVLCG
jgi:hypothetical protein